MAAKTTGQDCEYKICLMGGGGVGKSCLVGKFISNRYSPKYDPTIEDSYRKTMEVNGEACMVDILDTAGQEEYFTLLDRFVQDRRGFLLVYSITSKSSFDQIEGFVEKILHAKEEDDVMNIIVVGNKLDLEKERQVSTEEGAELARKLNERFKSVTPFADESMQFVSFRESSAKTGTNVQEIFSKLIQDMRAASFSQAGKNAPAQAKQDGSKGGCGGCLLM